jgi:hypothetical protein
MDEIVRLDPAWRQAVRDCMACFGYGDIIAMEWLRSKFEIDFSGTMTAAEYQERCFMFLSSMDGFRDELLFRHKMALKNIRGEGYLIIRPADHTDFAIQEAAKLIARGLRKGADILENTDFTQLSSDELRKNSDAQAKLGSLRSLSKEKLGTARAIESDARLAVGNIEV